MGLFGGDEYTDYTLLKKKGLLKTEEKKEEGLKMKDGFVDLTSATVDAVEDRISDNASGNANAPNLDFLGNMASIGAGNENKEDKEEQEKESADVKIKLEELEYKIEQLIERLEKLESKVGQS